MSKDIRSYFTKSNGSNTSKTSSKLSQSSPQSKKRVHRVIESDDEDDNDLIVTKKKPKEQSSSSKAEKKKSEIVVQVEHFFGNKPVQQKKQTVALNQEGKSEKPSWSKSKKKREKKALDLFENDDELEASFLQADDEQLLSKTEEKIKTPKKDTIKEKVNPQKSESEEKRKTPRKEANVEVKHNKTPKSEGKRDSDLQNSEQKRRNAEAYQKYLQRSGPKNPGSKKVPEGTPTCLQGLTFVITGVLDSLEREEATELIQKCGGRVTGSVSKKTDYIVVGEEPGVSKIQKADNFKIRKLNEDELLELIQEKSNQGEKEKDNFVEGTPEKTVSKYFGKDSGKKRTKKPEEVKEESKKSKLEGKRNEPEVESKPTFFSEHFASVSHTKDIESSHFKKIDNKDGETLWVDKYKPKSTKNIVGQMGEKSNVKKLIKWLQNWHANHSNKEGKKSARPAPWNQNDSGSYFKAALLSGPPGVGKTTTVHLVCQELGMDIIEFNASDTRSKRLLQEEVMELLSSRSIRGFLQGSGESYQKHVLVMDEVDGMAGNEDRGGIQELIQLIKHTKVPIIGICNDRSHPKMRSLVNYCFDLRFQRPRVEQIKGAMKSICFKENLEISGEALEELIIASNHDLRQILHNLSLLATGHKSLSLEEAKRKGEQAKKPLNLSPWDVVRKVFSASEHEKMSFVDKTDLFFQDYSLGPLFVQDTYLRVKPYKAKNSEKKKLELISKAAESLALGDVIERTIRTQNAWGLLPAQAVFSSVLPGHYMSGHLQGQVQFPVWFGKNSRSNKMERLLQELHSTLRACVTGTKQSVNLEYLHNLKNAITKPLLEGGSQGVQNSLEFMLNYHLTKEDLDCIIELSAWPGVKDVYSQLDSKVKAALTRVLNKTSQMVVSKKSVKLKVDENLEVDEVEEDLEETETNEIDSDPMIKVGKPRDKPKSEDKPKMKEEKKKGNSKKETKKGKK